ncbi:MAG TPA: alpha/beta hydrolase [Candidatus Agrococcus pullicola]|uniref:Alpha/beta hydrolase n=1 Tax=Candidatus Agrococcus pullicola TaxID=2838429 RepID=A0A9D1Z146_9MICO|nr:alpha/beta hydrolase [Candidatus Agrococcus pullicola]
MIADAVRTLELPTHRVRYAARKAENSPTPLMFLHGGAVDYRMWGRQLADFPERSVFAPDARGHGGSSDAEEPYRLVDDVIDLMDALGLERVIPVGISMGGGTAVDLALEYPERTSGVIVSGTGTSEPEFHGSWAQQTFRELADAEREADIEHWLAVFMRFTSGPYRSRADMSPEVWTLVERMARDIVTEHTRVGPDGAPIQPLRPTPVLHTWERLENITVPVLALPGALDGPDHRSLGRRVAAAVPSGEYAEVSNSGHYPNLENPESFNGEIKRFLARHGL